MNNNIYNEAYLKAVNQGDVLNNAAGRKLHVSDMISDNPGLEKYESSYRSCEFLKSRGFDEKVYFLHECAQFSLLWDKFDDLNAVKNEDKIYPIGSAEREAILKEKKRIKTLYSESVQNGMKVYFMMDLISLPDRLLDMYGESLRTNRKIDIKKPAAKMAMDCLFEEMFEEFPEIAGIYIRYGENYVGEKYGIPNFTGNNPIIGEVMDYQMYLINYLRKTVCVKYNREIIYRTWGFGEFQYNRDLYYEVSNKILPHKNFTFCIKHTKGDFHRMQEFNRCLNIGKHRQIVEIQCAREYEGKGAFPNYIANGVINGFEELKNSNVKGLADVVNCDNSIIDGVFTWSRGGGWNGPYINGLNGKKNVKYPDDINGEVTILNGSELWCDLNAYVIAQWSKDTSKTDKYFAKKYAREILGYNDNDSETFYKICILSARAVLLGQYTELENVDFNVWWIRDQNVNKKIFEENVKNINNSGLSSEFINEKELSKNIWSEIYTLSCTLDESNSVSEYIKTTSKYGLYLFSIIKNVYEYALTGDDRCLSQYSILWEEWTDMYKINPRCPSLYIKDDSDLYLIGYSGNTGFDGIMKRSL